MPASTLADLLAFDKHILAAYSTLLTTATPPIAVYALSNEDTTYPSVSFKYEAGEVPRRYLLPTAGPLAGKRLADHRPGELTFELRTSRESDDHTALLSQLLSRLEDANDELPPLLPFYAIVEARQLGAPLSVLDERETVTTITWQFDLFILPSAVPTSPTAIGYYTNRDLTNRLAASGGTSTALLSTVNHGTSTYVRNAALWLGDPIDPELTGIPVYTGPTARSRGALITSRHLLVATHYPPLVNAPVRFVDADGEVVERTVSEIRTVAGTDISIAVLSAEVPPEVAFYRLAPGSLLYQASSASMVDADGKVLAVTIGRTGLFFTHTPAATFPLSQVTEPIVTGDSGSPFFFVLDSEVVILGTALGAGTSPLASDYFTELVALCAPENRTPALFNAAPFIV